MVKRVSQWQKDLLEAIILTNMLGILEDVKKHCDCTYIDQKIYELQKKYEKLKTKYEREKR